MKNIIIRIFAIRREIMKNLDIKIIIIKKLIV